MIEIKQLNKRYANGVQALTDINLNIPKGSICGAIGKSGAGKSSLIRCVNHLETPSSGQVFIDGDDVTRLSGKALRKIRAQMGMIFQHFNLLSSRTVFDNVALPLVLAHKKARIIREKTDNLLQLVGLQEKANVYPSQLSGGQKQRVAIARALANDPKVLLCDEATSALDPQTTGSILTLLKTINQQLGLTILLITHEIEVVKTICDQVVILDKGCIIEQGAVLDVFSQPQTALAKTFIRSALHAELPSVIRDALNLHPDTGKHPVLRIEFHGAVTNKPLISHLSKIFNLACNILQANTEMVHDETFGSMFLEILGTKTDIAAGLAYLNENNLTSEVIGYVND